MDDVNNHRKFHKETFIHPGETALSSRYVLIRMYVIRCVLAKHVVDSLYAHTISRR